MNDDSSNINSYPRLSELASAAGVAHIIATVDDASQERLADEIQQLDERAYEQFKSKMSCTVGRQKPWLQFLDDINQIKGYAHLKSQGYSDIQFVKTEQFPTPDLSAKIDGARGLLEVKTIYTSDYDNAYVRQAFPKEPREVLYELPDGLKNKLNRDIAEARKQLMNFPCCEPVVRRIILFVVRLDVNCATNEMIQALSVFLDAASDTDVTIAHQIENTIRL